MASAEADSDNMKEFFDEVARIRDAIASIKTSIDDIEALHQKALNVISESQSSAMEAANKKLAKTDKNGSDLRMRISQHGAVTKKFIDIMTEYKDIQKKYQEKYKQRLQRQFLVVQPNAKPEEIEKMLDSEQGPVFAQQKRGDFAEWSEERGSKSIERYTRPPSRHDSILELQQLFVDMAVLVSAQGEMMNQIEIHVGSAVDNTEQGVQALHKAVKLQKKTRKLLLLVLALDLE
ncbi:Syntaxin-1A [Nowakowskiella sp. JEL0078]|nr:Syntaxin-1A [Nowakowskiella sp. JEL0078]